MNKAFSNRSNRKIQRMHHINIIVKKLFMTKLQVNITCS